MFVVLISLPPSLPPSLPQVVVLPLIFVVTSILLFIVLLFSTSEAVGRVRPMRAWRRTRE